MEKKGEKEATDLNVISRYTRAQAMEDGVLHDVSELAREAGFRYPVAITTGVQAELVRVPKALKGLQDEAGRLWDILHCLRFAIRNAKGPSNPLLFQVLVQQEAASEPKPMTLKSVCGPGDSHEPVITIMPPAED